MKKVMIILVFLVFSMNVCNVSASTNQTVSASTGEIDVGGGIKVELFCEYNVGLVTPDKIEPGKTSEVSMYLYSGSWTIRVYVPDPVNQWVSRDLVITSSGPITITPGLSVHLDITPHATLEAHGPATLDTTEINWGQTTGSKQIIMRCYSEAQHGSTITINAILVLDLILGIDIDLVLFKQNIANFDLTQLELTPKISENIPVNSLLGGLFSFVMSPISLFGGIFFLLFLIIGVGIYKGKKKRDLMIKEQTIPIKRTAVSKSKEAPKEPKKMKYCIHCGEMLPVNATFCGNCGKSRD